MISIEPFRLEVSVELFKLHGSVIFEKIHNKSNEVIITRTIKKRQPMSFSSQANLHRHLYCINIETRINLKTERHAL